MGTFEQGKRAQAESRRTLICVFGSLPMVSEPPAGLFKGCRLGRYSILLPCNWLLPKRDLTGPTARL